MWLTTADETQKLAPAAAARRRSARRRATKRSRSIPTQRFQKMHGFGAAMTDASAELFSGLPDDKRKAIMAELFGRANGGLGLSFTRLTVGASDFSTSALQLRRYARERARSRARTFLDRSGAAVRAAAHARGAGDQSRPQGDDQPVERAGVDEDDAQPDHRASSSRNIIPPFANYLARTVEEFGREGVPVSMLTIQNEPDFEPDDYPGMRVNSPDRAVDHRRLSSARRSARAA